MDDTQRHLSCLRFIFTSFGRYIYIHVLASVLKSIFVIVPYKLIQFEMDYENYPEYERIIRKVICIVHVVLV